MIKRLIILFFFLILVGCSYALNVEGIIDVCPVGFVVDRATPFAVHFSCWTSSFPGFAIATAKIQIQSGIMPENNYTWSTARWYRGLAQRW